MVDIKKYVNIKEIKKHIKEVEKIITKLDPESLEYIYCCKLLKSLRQLAHDYKYNPYLLLDVALQYITQWLYCLNNSKIELKPIIDKLSTINNYYDTIYQAL
jgi:hypothetical protein